jgi:hypothetical protein
MTEKPEEKLQEGRDFYYDENRKVVFTTDYLFRRGYCCESGCRHCPYGYGQPKKPGKPSFEI